MSARKFSVSLGKLDTQAGMVLLLGLIFLTALTLLGLTASADTILQNKLAANLQETERAKQSALATLTWAENWLLEFKAPAPEYCSEPCSGLYLHPAGNLPPNPETESLSWWTDHGHVAGINPLNGERIIAISNDSFDAPLWIVEELHSIPAAENNTDDLQVWYRILARGSGRTGAVISVIESTVVRSWPSIDNADLSDAEVSIACSETESPARCGRITWRELR
jgi:Tfp pilus assembly protein PilX